MLATCYVHQGKRSQPQRMPMWASTMPDSRRGLSKCLSVFFHSAPWLPDMELEDLMFALMSFYFAFLFSYSFLLEQKCSCYDCLDMDASTCTTEDRTEGLMHARQQYYPEPDSQSFLIYICILK